MNLTPRSSRRVLLLLTSLGWALCLHGCASSTSSGAPVGSDSSTLTRSDVPAGINDRFLDPELDPDEWVNRWEVESREVYAGRRDIVEAAAIEKGDAVADVGSGTGLFVAPFSEAVGSRGKVYALDIAPKFIEHLRRRKVEEGLSNVEVILSGEASTKLPTASVDVVFVCDTYHHFEYHEAMLDSIRDALRPGGRLVILDFERIPGVSREWILGHVRAGKEQVRGEIESAGFRFEEEIDLPVLEENYLMRFVRP